VATPIVIPAADPAAWLEALGGPPPSHIPEPPPDGYAWVVVASDLGPDGQARVATVGTIRDASELPIPDPGYRLLYFHVPEARFHAALSGSPVA
jgi:hypothetical protein